jgi:hypothetical protein
MSKLNDYKEALKKLEKNPDDRIGILAKVGIITTGTMGGFALSGSAAAAAGASTLFGSTTLATLASGIFVTTTPVGWVVGASVAGGALAYGLTKMYKSGVVNDGRKKDIMEKLRERIVKEKNINKTNSEKISSIAGIYVQLIELHLLTEEEVKLLLEQIKNGSLDYDVAYQLAKIRLDEALKNQLKIMNV